MSKKRLILFLSCILIFCSCNFLTVKSDEIEAYAESETVETNTVANVKIVGYKIKKVVKSSKTSKLPNLSESDKMVGKVEKAGIVTLLIAVFIFWIKEGKKYNEKKFN